MILLAYVVQILCLSNLDRGFAFGNDCVQPREVRSALVNCHGLRDAVLIDGFLEVTPGGHLVPLGAEQKIDRFASFVDGPVQVFDDADHFARASSRDLIFRMTTLEVQMVYAHQRDYRFMNMKNHSLAATRMLY